MILQIAIDHYGVESQLNKVDEELKELIEALDNWRKDKTKLPELVDEIADVMIMLEQLEMIASDICEVIVPILVDHRKEYKLNRLKQRIEDDNNKSRLL